MAERCAIPGCGEDTFAWLDPRCVEHRNTAIPSSPPLPTYAELVASVKRSREPIKLTREQFDAIPRVEPRPYGALGTFAGTPVHIVDTVEESTPYRLRRLTRERIADMFRLPAAFGDPAPTYDDTWNAYQTTLKAYHALGEARTALAEGPSPSWLWWTRKARARRARYDELLDAVAAAEKAHHAAIHRHQLICERYMKRLGHG